MYFKSLCSRGRFTSQVWGKCWYPNNSLFCPYFVVFSIQTHSPYMYYKHPNTFLSKSKHLKIQSKNILSPYSETHYFLTISSLFFPIFSLYSHHCQYFLMIYHTYIQKHHLSFLSFPFSCLFPQPTLPIFPLSTPYFSLFFTIFHYFFIFLTLEKGKT